MILFTPAMAEKILAGEKTVTRRRGKKRWNVGAIHQCYTRPPFAKGGAEPFAAVRIVSIFEEGYVGQGVGISEQHDAEREGFDGWPEFCAAYTAINAPSSSGRHVLAEPCWRIAFEVAKEAAS